MQIKLLHHVQFFAFMSLTISIKFSAAQQSAKYTLFDPLDIDENFQLLDSNNVHQCGTRAVKFEVQRIGRIIGGQEMPYGSFPWQVQIKIFNYSKKKFQHHCGGALISEKIIITAAHCLQVPKLEYLRIVFGNHFLMERDLFEHGFRVDDIIIHPQYTKYGPYSNDIALLKVLAKHIIFSNHIRTICLPELNDFPEIGNWCTVAGWGVHDIDDTAKVANSLRAASVPILDLNTCKNKAINGGRSQKILDTMLCAGFLDGRRIDACSGDSGGPLGCEKNGIFYLTGIVSFGDGCGKKIAQEFTPKCRHSNNGFKNQ